MESSTLWDNGLAINGEKLCSLALFNRQTKVLVVDEVHTVATWQICLCHFYLSKFALSFLSNGIADILASTAILFYFISVLVYCKC